MFRLFPFFFVSSLAQASVSFRPVSEVRAQGSWVCTASGIDARGEPRSVNGGFQASKNSAKANAIHACRGALSECALSGCQREP